MEKEKYSDSKAKIHLSFIRFTMARPWLHNINYLSSNGEHKEFQTKDRVVEKVGG